MVMRMVSKFHSAITSVMVSFIATLEKLGREVLIMKQ